jgi:hypothetical protein
MPPVGFEPTIPAFERAKTVQDLDRIATVIGVVYTHVSQFSAFWIIHDVVFVLIITKKEY